MILVDFDTADTILLKEATCTEDIVIFAPNSDMHVNQPIKTPKNLYIVCKHLYINNAIQVGGNIQFLVSGFSLSEKLPGGCWVSIEAAELRIISNGKVNFDPESFTKTKIITGKLEIITNDSTDCPYSIRFHRKIPKRTYREIPISENSRAIKFKIKDTKDVKDTKDSKDSKDIIDAKGSRVLEYCDAFVVQALLLTLQKKPLALCEQALLKKANDAKYDIDIKEIRDKDAESNKDIKDTKDAKDSKDVKEIVEIEIGFDRYLKNHAIKCSDPKIQFGLSLCYGMGIIEEVNFEKRLASLNSATHQGSKKARHILNLQKTFFMQSLKMAHSSIRLKNTHYYQVDNGVPPPDFGGALVKNPDHVFRFKTPISSTEDVILYHPHCNISIEAPIAARNIYIVCKQLIIKQDLAARQNIELLTKSKLEAININITALDGHLKIVSAGVIDIDTKGVCIIYARDLHLAGRKDVKLGKQVISQQPAKHLKTIGVPKNANELQKIQIELQERREKMDQSFHQPMGSIGYREWEFYLFSICIHNNSLDPRSHIWPDKELDSTKFQAIFDLAESFILKNIIVSARNAAKASAAKDSKELIEIDVSAFEARHAELVQRNANPKKVYALAQCYRKGIGMQKDLQASQSCLATLLRQEREKLESRFNQSPQAKLQENERLAKAMALALNPEISDESDARDAKEHAEKENASWKTTPDRKTLKALEETIKGKDQLEEAARTIIYTSSIPNSKISKIEIHGIGRKNQSEKRLLIHFNDLPNFDPEKEMNEVKEMVDFFGGPPAISMNGPVKPYLLICTGYFRPYFSCTASLAEYLDKLGVPSFIKDDLQAFNCFKSMPKSELEIFSFFPYLDFMSERQYSLLYEYYGNENKDMELACFLAEVCQRVNQYVWSEKFYNSATGPGNHRLPKYALVNQATGLMLRKTREEKYKALAKFLQLGNNEVARRMVTRTLALLCDDPMLQSTTRLTNNQSDDLLEKIVYLMESCYEKEKQATELAIELSSLNSQVFSRLGAQELSSLYAHPLPRLKAVGYRSHILKSLNFKKDTKDTKDSSENNQHINELIKLATSNIELKEIIPHKNAIEWKKCFDRKKISEDLRKKMPIEIHYQNPDYINSNFPMMGAILTKSPNGATLSIRVFSKDFNRQTKANELNLKAIISRFRPMCDSVFEYRHEFKLTDHTVHFELITIPMSNLTLREFNFLQAQFALAGLIIPNNIIEDMESFSCYKEPDLEEIKFFQSLSGLSNRKDLSEEEFLKLYDFADEISSRSAKSCPEHQSSTIDLLFQLGMECNNAGKMQPPAFRDSFFEYAIKAFNAIPQNNVYYNRARFQAGYLYLLRCQNPNSLDLNQREILLEAYKQFIRVIPPAKGTLHEPIWENVKLLINKILIMLYCEFGLFSPLYFKSRSTSLLHFLGKAYPYLDILQGQEEADSFQGLCQLTEFYCHYKKDIEISKEELEELKKNNVQTQTTANPITTAFGLQATSHLVGNPGNLKITYTGPSSGVLSQFNKK